jgi:hypothetical protein
MSIKILTVEEYRSGFEACEANIGEVRFCTNLSYDWEDEIVQGMVVCVQSHGRIFWRRWDHLIANSNYDDEKHALRAQLAKKKCAIPGCPGMCARDFEEYNPKGFEVCFCCKKKQELECPICLETHKTNNMVCGSKCSHHICWKCYGMAHRGGNGIEKCPMCRADF